MLGTLHLRALEHLKCSMSLDLIVYYIYLILKCLHVMSAGPSKDFPVDAIETNDADREHGADPKNQKIDPNLLRTMRLQNRNANKAISHRVTVEDDPQQAQESY